MKKSVRFPKYMFTGSGLIIALIVFLFINSNERSKREVSYLTNPQIGDVYHIKDIDEPTEYKYTLWRAEELFEDSMYVTANVYSYNKMPKTLLAEDGFSSTYYVIDKSSLMDLYEKGELIKVQREYTENSGFTRIIQEQADSLQVSEN